ncbi:MAG: carbohydrate ABC transporter substrate-binding protein [Oscillospiraceae bacterium]|jgi:hypothetical protein|nr:carbohydrate ABC transporter substrate-binding protein [Oscillospiraceae bacterium]
MKTLKRTLALIAALTVVATTFAGCGDKKEEDTTKPATTTAAPAATDAAGGDTATDAPEAETTEAPPSEAPQVGAPADDKVTLGTGGSEFTIVSWNANDFPALLATFVGKVDQVDAADATVNVGLIEDATTDTGATINFINLGVGSADAKQTYDNMLSAGEDIDIYAAEADFALDYIGDTSKSADFTTMGFAESDWANAYSYTLEIGKDANGSLRGISWQACPGGYAYRTDLAETYLGVTDTAAMQDLVKDWDTMGQTAAKVYEASGEKTAMAATMGGMWQVFAPARDKAWVVDETLVADDAQSLKFLTMAKDWADKGYVTKVGQWTDAWLPMGQDDSVMGYFVSTWGLGDTIVIGAAGGKTGATFGQWGIVQGPQAFSWGGTWFIVNPATDNGIDAKNFIYDLTLDEETMAAYAKAKGEYMNNKKVMAQGTALANDDITANFGGQDYISLLSEAAANIKMDAKKITRYDSVIKADFMTAVTDYANGNYADETATLDAFKNKVAEDVPAITVN